MKEQLVSYKLAKLLKQKGFNLPLYEYYSINEKLYIHQYLKYNWNSPDSNRINDHHKDRCLAPTLSLAAKWLREEHGRHIITIPTVTSDYTFKVIRVLCKKDFDKDGMVLVDTEQPPYRKVDASDYNTHEEALSKAIYETLDLI